MSYQLTMFDGLLQELNNLIQSSRGVGIVTLLAATLAGMFGYEFLTLKKGLLRRFLVGLVAGVITGLIIYSIDFETQHRYSSALQELLSIPQSGVNPFLFAILGAVGGLLEGIVSSNNFTFYDEPVSKLERILTIVVFFVDLTFINAILTDINFSTFPFLGPVHLPIPIIFGISIVLALFEALLVANSDAIRKRIDRDQNTNPNMPIAARAAFAIGLIVVFFALAMYYLLYLGYILGIGLLLYLPPLIICFVALYFIERFVAKLEKRGMAIVSFAWFLLAVMLQLYQLLRFTAS